jgi:hypothetical protein
MPVAVNRRGGKALTPQLGIAGGTILLLASFVVPEQSLSQSAWTAEQAQRYQQSALRVHELAHEAGHSAEKGDAANIERELAAAQENFGEVQAELDSATERPRRFKAILRWSGIAIALVGIVAHFVVNSK